MRRAFSPAALLPALALLAGCVAGTSSPAPGQRGVSDPRPDLVVVLADDLGFETLGCYGGESYATPELDRLAGEGLRFTRAFTQPLCTPTRVELLTGRSNARNYRAFSVLDPSERTFAHLLHDAGYRTAAVGKWQLLAAEHYAEPIRGSGTRPEHAGFEEHLLWQVESLGSRHWAPRLTADGVTSDHPEELYGPDLTLEAGLEWLDRDDTRPALLFWPMILPHAPFLAPPGFEGQRTGKGDPSLYGPMVEYMDQLVGRLAARLRERERPVLLVFLGDNGTPRGITSLCSGEERVGGKAKHGDAGSRVPFLAWSPSLVDGGRIHDGLVASVDVLPTLLDVAGVEPPTDRPLDGWSFRPLLREGEHPPHREFVTFHHHPRPSNEGTVAARWARDERWQLFEDGRLFEAETDPYLERPLEGHEEVRSRLRAALATLPPVGEADFPAPVPPR